MDDELQDLRRRSREGDTKATLELAALEKRLSGTKVDPFMDPSGRADAGRLPGRVYANLQWKGGPCVDTWCPCGRQWHRCDTEYMYYLRCPECSRVFLCSPNVELVELTQEEVSALRAEKGLSSGYVPWKEMGEPGGPSEPSELHDTLQLSGLMDEARLDWIITRSRDIRDVPLREAVQALVKEVRDLHGYVTSELLRERETP